MIIGYGFTPESLVAPPSKSHSRHQRRPRHIAHVRNNFQEVAALRDICLAHVGLSSQVSTGNFLRDLRTETYTKRCAILGAFVGIAAHPGCDFRRTR